MAGIDIEGLAPVYPDGVRAVDGLESETEGKVRIDSADVTRVEPGRLPDSDGSGGSVSVAGGSLPAATGSVPAGA